MKGSGNHTAPHPIIIVRRKRGHEDGHHGGVWKIAYADFMTAMMAFFLVMWLINMTDDKTIVQVAAYFNPLRLSDKSPSERGIHDHTTRPRDEAMAVNSNSEPVQHETVQEKKKRQRELDMFKDVRTMLDDLAAKAARVESTAGSSPLAGADVARKDEAIMRDPFDPAQHSPGASRAKKNEVPDPLAEAGLERLPVFPKGAEVKGTKENKVDADNAKRAASEAEAKLAALEADAKRKAAEAEVEQRRSAEAEANRRDVAAEIRTEMLAVQSQLGGKAPDVDITPVPEGILIRLTDKSDISMFAIGSAEPQPNAVVLIERIGAMLKGRPGSIVISGHTDGRAYRNNTYDNWRLSSARAHMTYHMLLRGGLTDDRFERVEGYADRKPAVPEDKLAYQNRRIEILLRAP
jgi:chemotaxis protein MotB